MMQMPHSSLCGSVIKKVPSNWKKTTCERETPSSCVICRKKLSLASISHFRAPGETAKESRVVFAHCLSLFIECVTGSLCAPSKVTFFFFPFESWKLDHADKCLRVTRMYCHIVGFDFDLVTACTVNKMFSFLLCLLSSFSRTCFKLFFFTASCILVDKESFLEKGQVQVRCFISSQNPKSSPIKNHKNIIRTQSHTQQIHCVCVRNKRRTAPILRHVMLTFKLFSSFLSSVVA